MMDFRTNFEKIRDDFILPLGKKYNLRLSKNKKLAMLYEYNILWSNLTLIELDFLIKHEYKYWFTLGSTTIFRKK